jgi:hypothetical protein
MTGTPRYLARRTEATGIRRPATQDDRVTGGDIRLLMVQVAVRWDVGTGAG